jgi:hypothetical protein
MLHISSFWVQFSARSLVSFTSVLFSSVNAKPKSLSHLLSDPFTVVRHSIVSLLRVTRAVLELLSHARRTQQIETGPEIFYYRTYFHFRTPPLWGKALRFSWTPSQFSVFREHHSNQLFQTSILLWNRTWHERCRKTSIDETCSEPLHILLVFLSYSL